MAGIEAKSFEDPDETVAFDHGRVNLVKVSSLAVGREVLKPGWRWSVHVKPIVGTERCEFHHVSVLLEGLIGVESRDGEVRELVAGDVSDIAPGHDAWVVRDQPAVQIDFQGVVGWAKAPEPGERVLTTLLFTDIVGSTGMAERRGDRSWKHVLASRDIERACERGGSRVCRAGKPRPQRVHRTAPALSGAPAPGVRASPHSRLPGPPSGPQQLSENRTVVRYRIPPACLISSPRSMNTTGSSPATQAS